VYVPYTHLVCIRHCVGPPISISYSNFSTSTVLLLPHSDDGQVRWRRPISLTTQVVSFSSVTASLTAELGTAHCHRPGPTRSLAAPFNYRRDNCYGTQRVIDGLRRRTHSAAARWNDTVSELHGGHTKMAAPTCQTSVMFDVCRHSGSMPICMAGSLLICVREKSID